MEKKSLLITVAVTTVCGVMLVVLGMLLGRAFAQAPLPAGATSPAQFDNTATFVGHGVVKAKPEIAHISLGIEICEGAASQANQEVNSRLITITAELKTAGVPADGIVPTDFSMYSRSNNMDPQVTDFCAANALVVTTDKLNEVSRLLDVAIEAGATNVYGVSFTVKDTSKARQEAISRALADAQQQAERLSGLLNRSVAHIVKVDVTLQDDSSQYYTGYSGGGGSVAPQANSIESTVTVVFELPLQ
jgi:uncharacterized protein